MAEKFGIYIHWPFCERKCPYCGFFSEANPNIDQTKIIKDYLSDIDYYHSLTTDKTVTSIFFGGGTPSLIKPHNIETLLNHIHKRWKTTPQIEISLEANPNSLNAKDLKTAGINRLSLGVQSLRDDDLKFLGRIHNRHQALKAIDSVLKTFDNHSMDLIYARPNQTTKNWQEELSEAVNFGFKHLSLYQLTIEENTPFYQKNIKSLDDASSANLYNFTEQFLKAKEYERYEVSNHAQKGFESQHNLTYWQGWDYIGIGPSAHGRIGLQATSHPRKLEALSQKERATELLLMGLRLKKGIDKETFQTQCGLNFNTFINQKNKQMLIDLKLITDNKKSLRLTAKGFPVLDKIIENLLS